MEETKALIAQRDELEREIARLKEYLDSPEVRNFRCVDAEGFPDRDTEKILAVRAARNRLAVCTNDAKALMLQIEESLHRLHASARPTASAAVVVQQQQKIQPPSPQPANLLLRATSRAIVVDQVAPQGPAEAAGLCVGDRVLRFGTVDVDAMLADAAVGAADVLGAISGVVGASVGESVSVAVLRDGAETHLTLVPRTWAGRGLLGCHLSLDPA